MSNLQKISIPDFSLVVLIGVTGSGKSTFAHTHFRSTEIVSSDSCRGIVSDDENDQSASNDAFALLHFIVSKRLERMRLTVVDATNVQAEARKTLLQLARQYHALPVAIVLDVPERLCIERNQQRPDRNFGAHVIARQRRSLKDSLRDLKDEGFRRVFVLKSAEEIAGLSLVREPLWTNRKAEHGPFDMIGDVHGCFDELATLLSQLGYTIDPTTLAVTPPEGRKAIFLGDLVDRGPKIPQVLKLVMGMVKAGTALCVPGNHDVKLLRKLRGKNVQLTHGITESIAQLDLETAAFREEVADFLDSLISHYVLDDGKLVVAHAGMKESMAGRASGTVRDFALYGETTGEADEFGLPARYNWAADYRGDALVVYGHTPVPTPEWLNRTINIDTGCVFGGALTALRYPERTLISVAAQQVYAQPIRPLLVEPAQVTSSAQQIQDNFLDISDVLVLDANLGKRLIDTRLQKNITIRAENAAAALEVMSRFAVDPKWLIYLPPTMSPCETSRLPDYLERPEEAFAYFRNAGVGQVICEEKHMGSRAMVVICNDETVAQRRFGVEGGEAGVVYTRTGRRFFSNPDLERVFLDELRQSISQAGLWEELDSQWLLLDCELMPWSAKAQELLQTQYAAVGSSAAAALQASVGILQQAATSNPAIAPLLEKYQARQTMVQAYIDAYRHYCWEVNSLHDLRLAPFHLLASEGAVHIDKNHLWHMSMLQNMTGPLIVPTQFKVIEPASESSVNEGVAWWEDLTQKGGEGMVVKPFDFLTFGQRGMVQPAIKVRGREYLRIIYGAEYTAPDQIEQLRTRGLSGKRSLALREFVLGIEAMERFVRQEPLRRVHECVFGILAMESEPIDPRL